MIRRVPVTGSKDRQLMRSKIRQVTVEQRNDYIATGNCEAAARQKIILHIRHDQGIT